MGQRKEVRQLSKSKRVKLEKKIMIFLSSGIFVFSGLYADSVQAAPVFSSGSASDSTVAGVNNTASANSSSAFGYFNTASGLASSAFGWSNTASAEKPPCKISKRAVSDIRRIGTIIQRPSDAIISVLLRCFFLTYKTVCLQKSASFYENSAIA